MSGGAQTLMRTRCPACGTIFRVTSEQLRRKAGKVRCGHCQSVFNAFDEWQADTVESSSVAQAPDTDIDVMEPAQSSDMPAVAEHAADADPESPEAIEDQVESSSSVPSEEAEDWVPENELQDEPEVPVTVLEDRVPEMAVPDDVGINDAPLSEPTDDVDAVPVPKVVSPELLPESPEASTQAAREAGLVAARELSETSSYNRWAAGTLTADGLGGFAVEPARRAIWPFVLVALLLLVSLLLQLLYHFRSEVALRVPAAAALYEMAAVDIPLPRNPALVSIETSDLQSDNARGLFVLQATLKNSAAYSQAWPALELSLTDTNDSVVSRRVMYAAEYLPPGTTSDVFPANAEVAIQLWIEARNIGASGYRLYIFYP